MKRPPPKTLRWSGSGWRFEGTPEERVETAGEDSARLEVGHTYVLAIAWEAARCLEGDPKQPAWWRPIGSGAMIPYDDATLGVGELEGTVHTLEEMRAARTDATSLRANVLGNSTRDLIDALRAAKPRKREIVKAPAPCES